MGKSLSNTKAQPTYFRRWFDEFRSELRSLTKDIIVLVLVIVTLLVQWRMGWIQVGHGWQTIVVNLPPPIGILLIFLSIYAFQAVVHIDERREQQIAALRNVLESWPQRVELIKLLRGYHREGELLKEELEKLDYPPLSLEQRTKTWRMYSANMLLQRRRETYEEKFNKIGAKPELSELGKLHNQIHELKKAIDEAGTLPESDANKER